MRRAVASLAVNGALVAAAALTLMPLLWMLSASLMPAGEATAVPPRLLPSAPTLEHYRTLFTRLDLGRALLNSAGLAAVVTTLVAVAVVWRYLYHPRLGLLNYVLGRFGVDPIDWLGDPAWAMPAIILLAVWKNFGFNMVVFLAGLQSIPARLYEAAHLDGAGPWQAFRAVTLPLLRPTLVFVAVITGIGYFQLFAEPYVMTQGGPANSTLSVLLPGPPCVITYGSAKSWK